MNNLHFVLERIHRMTGIPIRCLNPEDKTVLLNYGLASVADPVVQDADLQDLLIGKLTAGNLPVLVFEEDGIVYGCCFSATREVIILGPISLEMMDPGQLQRYAHRHVLTNANNFFCLHRSIGELAAALAMTSYSASGIEETESCILNRAGQCVKAIPLQESELQNYRLDRSDGEIPRFGYDEEIQFIQMIKDGNAEAVKSFFDPAVVSRAGKVAQKTFKTYEYLACACITLATRAAIEGGLEPLTAYANSDLYLQRLETCRSIPEIFELMNDALTGFANRVRQERLNRSRSSYIEGSKAFINSHLNKPFMLSDIAEAIGINKSYLCRLFTTEIGKGIQRYTREKRVEAAASLIKYSDKSISEISAYLCFPSQSHFGKVFKELMGLTPQKYREKAKLTIRT